MAIKKTYNYTVDTSMMDKNGVLTVEGYQRIIITTTEKELERINLSIAHLIKEYGVSWILLSLSVKILKQITPGQELLVTTWHTWGKGVIFRRDFEICSINGEPLAYGASFSSLFDVEKRRLCMDRKIYEKINLEGGEELFPAVSRSAVEEGFAQTEDVSVRPHWIDCLGHVNNFKYGQLAFDNIPEDCREKSNKINRIEMFFTGELLLNEKVCIGVKNDNNLIQIAGIHQNGGHSAFLVKLHYEE